jgi:hypothetical protein
MRFLPMQFSLADLTALKPNHGRALEFTPSAWSILLLNPHDVVDSSARGNLFNVSNLPNYLKILGRFHLLISSHGYSPNN